ncbi:MAG: hypothetical protein JSW58_08520 [Candidatus Latescibacterota bacterium]|nr:MAG: hypothetical protein JSW58_08520 [Candidatus Latescibacterota bacterium]
MATPNLTIVFVVLESCIQPSGAYSRVRGRFSSQEKAVEHTSAIDWIGPEFGIQRDREMVVYQRTTYAQTGKTLRRRVYRRPLGRDL